MLGIINRVFQINFQSLKIVSLSFSSVEIGESIDLFVEFGKSALLPIVYELLYVLCEVRESSVV